MSNEFKPIHESPCAARGLLSYRFTTRDGTHVMIGAKDAIDASREARRSTSKAGSLYKWHDEASEYVVQAYLGENETYPRKTGKTRVF